MLSEFDSWCIDRFFLAPGSEGAIVRIEVSDDDLEERFGVEGADDVCRSFLRHLPSRNEIANILSGRSSTPERLHWVEVDGRRKLVRIPRYVPLLVFICWIQVTEHRERGHRDLRNLIEERLGIRIDRLDALPDLWTHLSTYLREAHQVDLQLPDGGFRFVGATVGMPFPTWRHLTRLRRLRTEILDNRRNATDGRDPLLDRRRVATAFRASPRIADAFEGIAGRSLRDAFSEWEASVAINALDVGDLAFERAWIRIANEERPSANLEFAVDDYSQATFFHVPSNGAAKPISGPLAGHGYLAWLRNTLRKGYVFLEPMGFGRWKASERFVSHYALLDGRRVRELDAVIRKSTQIADDWWIADIDRVPVESSRETSLEANFRLAEAVRVGASILARSPMGPRFQFSGEHPPRAVSADVSRPLVATGNEASLPPELTSGLVTVELGRTRRRYHLVDRAEEHHLSNIKFADSDAFRREDGAVADRVPDPVFRPRPTNEPGTAPGDQVIALGEALYARGRRGIAMSEFVSLCDRVRDPERDPSPFDIARAFVDAGWFEPVLNRFVQARAYALRPISLVSFDRGGKKMVVLDGPMPLRSFERLVSCAAQVGAEVNAGGGVGAWSLPRLSLSLGFDQYDEFVSCFEARPRKTLELSPRSDQWSEPLSLEDRDDVSVWDHRRGFFADQSTRGEDVGLLKFGYTADNKPAIYSIEKEGMAESFHSPTLSLLRYHQTRAFKPFVLDGGRIYRVGNARDHLPASWGRWLGETHLCNAGPVPTANGFTYAYPVDGISLAKMNRLLAVCDERSDAPAQMSWQHWRRMSRTFGVRSSRTGSEMSVGILEGIAECQ